MIKLSIIVPFYGVEPYIGQCLKSLFDQDLPESEYEVICVNDCSPDNSERIVLDYQKAHSNLALLRHEVNKRLGAARNTGLSAARGKYVWFVDSDDYIKENCLKEIVETCESNELDVLHWTIQDNHLKWMLRIEDSDVTTGIDDLLNGSRDMTYPWNRVYRKAFLLDNNLWFNDLWGGDVVHTIFALNYAQRLKNTSECYYFYRTDNSSSDMRSPVSAKKLISFCYVLGKAIDDCKKDLQPRLHSMIDECVAWRINGSFKPFLKLPIKQKREFYLALKEDNALKSFVLAKANSKVHFILSYPVIVYLMHPFYNLILRL